MDNINAHWFRRFLHFINQAKAGIKYCFTAVIIGIFYPMLACSADVPKILLIGDSLSSAYGIAGPGWVEQLNQAQIANVTIINDSISGDTTAGGVSRIRDGIERHAPDWVMIALGGNDGLRGLPPKLIQQNLHKMVDIAAEFDIPAMILGIRIPPNYGKHYTDQFEQTFLSVADATNSPLLSYFIGRVGGDPALNLPDGVHPNDAAQPIIRKRVWAFISSVIGVE